MAAVKLLGRAFGLADGFAAAIHRLLAFLGRRLWVASLPRAWAEAGLLVALLLAVVLQPMKSAPDPVIPATFLLFSLVSASAAALRLRLVPGGWLAGLPREALLSLTLTLLLAVVCAAILWIDGAGWLLQRSTTLPLAILPAIGMSVPAFLILRALARFWRWWDAQRRHHFVWALTHAQLTVVFLLGLLFMLLGLGVIAYTVHVELNDLASLPGSPPYSVFMQIVIWLLGLAFLTLLFIAIGSLVFSPGAVLFSYLVARGMTRRVETLARTAARLRAGDFTARVTVEGQDELAQLQEDFNRMAADLQQRTRDLEVRTLELQAERDRTAALFEAHRQLAASVSHELRTPVATARAYLDALLQHGAESSSGDLGHDLDVLSGEVSRLERLIDDLFTLSRVEIDRLSLEVGWVEIDPMLRRLVDAAEKPAWALRRVQVTLAECRERLAVRADPSRLEQIVRNLLQNSLRHTPPGGYVLVSAGRDPAGIRICVEDSGEGIEPADLPHIWERFYRSEGARRAGDGAGLGLALVKELAEAMGGQVGVETRPGEGSLFWVTLLACDTIATQP